MKVLSLIISLMLLLCGCSGPRYSDFFLYRDDGTMKHKVAFLPVLAADAEEQRAACYFDEALRYLALDHGELYFYDKEATLNNCKVKNLSCPIEQPKAFLPADFVVQVEVLQDAVLSPEEAGCKSFIPLPGMLSRSALKVKLRIQIVDIRGCEPKTVLYEILEKSQILSNKPSPQCAPVTVYEELAHQAIDRIEGQIDCMR